MSAGGGTESEVEESWVSILRDEQQKVCSEESNHGYVVYTLLQPIVQYFYY